MQRHDHTAAGLLQLRFIRLLPTVAAKLTYQPLYTFPFHWKLPAEWGDFSGTMHLHDEQPNETSEYHDSVVRACHVALLKYKISVTIQPLPLTGLRPQSDLVMLYVFHSTYAVTTLHDLITCCSATTVSVANKKTAHAYYLLSTSCPHNI